MMSNSDWTIPYLMKALWIVFIFLLFGAVLNGVVLRNNRLLVEKDHLTSLRISLLRAEYDRKLGDSQEKYKRTCELSVREAVKRLKATATEQKRNATLNLHHYFSDIMTNSSNEINKIAEDFNDIIHDTQQMPNRSALASILTRLKAIKLQASDVDWIQVIAETSTRNHETDGVW